MKNYFSMKSIRVHIVLSFLLMPLLSGAQSTFTVDVQASSISVVPPTHSGAMAVWNGKWIFLGGRIDGIHIMQDNQAFPDYGQQ